jgi:small-conductance mechanosensitive channel
MNLCRRTLLWVAILAALFLRQNNATAQSALGPLLAPATSGATPAAAAAPSVAEKRAENAELLRVAERKLESDPADTAAAAELAAFKTAETVLAQQEAVDQQVKDLEAHAEELRDELKRWSAPTHEPAKTISFVEFDRLVNRLAAEQARTELVRSKVKAAKAALEQAQIDFNAREQERRKAQDALEAGKTGPDAPALAAAVDEAKRASALAADAAALRKKELEREKLTNTVQGLTVELLQGQVDRYQPLVVFTQAELQQQLQKLKAQEESVRAALRQADDDAIANARNWVLAKRRLAAAGDKSPALVEEVEAWHRARDNALDQKNAALDQLLQIEQLRTAWTRLNKLMSDTTEHSTQELTTWKEETASALKVLIGSTQAHLLRIEELRGELATVLAKAAAAKDGPDDLRRSIDSQRGSIESMIRTHEANLVSIDASRRLHGKLRTELGRGIDLLSPEQWVRNAWGGVVWLWDYEISADENLSITVGRIVRALLIFFAGWMSSRMASQFFAHRLLRRFRLSKDATAVIRTVMFYSLVVAAALVALRTANVPLTAFTILGGAVAIGVGFGSQALVNNFISGLIMLAERPVRIGERVLFGSYDGVVEDVGFRCTKLRTLTDHLVTVPNSSLINDSIENVGRRRTIRRMMNLGITYDTPRERISQAVEAIREILEEPGIREPIHPMVGWDKFPPRVFFQDYLADSLNILVVYWFAPADHWEYMAHAEQVNLRIFEEFERLGVSFAFPSRTVYLANDSARDLRMRLSKEDAA